MEFNIKKTENPNIERYKKDELNTAYEFSKRLYDEFGTFLKAVVLFGSSARKENTKGDIDLLVIVDDATIEMGAELVETYRIIIEKVIAETSTRLHVTSLKLTTFWEYVRAGDPVAINILREGVSILDSGFFDPLRILLLKGRIRPSPEAIWNYFDRAPRTLHNSRWHITQAALDLYWAVIDAAHAALMKRGETPPSPEHAADMMEQKMVKQKLLEPKYPQIMREFYTLQKRIIHREIREVTTQQYEEYYKKASEFVHRMEKFLGEKKFS